MKVIDLFTDKVSNIRISYGVERERDLEKDDKSKKNKKTKMKKPKMKKYKKTKK
jgi:hypothetical protein|tara:strand:+ start:512 stop:673 length:162 start_codon:yes stop_codon:yes gene_type:complete